jgi:hypothetical protein
VIEEFLGSGGDYAARQRLVLGGYSGSDSPEFLRLIA